MNWEDKFIELFCKVDDFCKHFEPQWNKLLLSSKLRKRKSQMFLSEVMTIAINFHQSGYRTFKKYYTFFVRGTMNPYFPNAVSYSRFTELMQTIIPPLFCFLEENKGKVTGISFVDSTDLPSCHIKRALSNKTFKKIATKGKTTMGWFFGFKLHLVINDKGDLLSWCLTKANVDDRKPVPNLTKGITGLLFGDKGYISQSLFSKLQQKSLKLVTRLKSNMKNKLMTLHERLLLKKRGIIESVNDQLKNISQISHTRHRSTSNFLSNLMSGLISYTLQDKKPSLKLRKKYTQLLMAA